MGRGGRGAPEVDLFEGMAGPVDPLPNTKITKPYFSTSLQVSPGVSAPRPVLTHRPLKGKWYEGMSYGPNTTLNNFFYGVTLKHSPSSYTYQSDAISANTQLGLRDFSDFQTFAVDWRPGESLEWFHKGVSVYKITQESLTNVTGASIPLEPSYLIMNTAISSTWGFPAKAAGCECKTYECGDPECDCALPPGFCDNLPHADFEVDYVRVWQEKESLGCSPKAYPTRKYVAAFPEKFSLEGSTTPLLPVRRGGGACVSSSDCGDDGDCVEGKCVCRLKTGPNCRATDMSYPPGTYVDVDVDEVRVSGVYVPVPLAVGLGALALAG